MGDTMKKITVFALTLALVAFGVSPASAQDAFNADLTPTADGRATFLVGEDNVGVRFSTMLAGKNNIRNIRWSCESVTDPECSRSKADFIASSSLLKVCTSGADQNCVVRLELAGEDGIFQPATFLRNTNGLNFAAHAGTGFMGATTPSLWSAPGVPSKSGTTEYAVMVRAENHLQWSSGRFETNGLVASVVPYREVKGNYEAPYQFTTDENHRGEKGFAGGGGSPECAWAEDGSCGILQDFAPNTRVKITVRISDEVGGWFKGRIKNPLITVSRSVSGMNDITVEAAPAEVPRMVYQTNLSGLTATERKYAMDNGLSGLWSKSIRTWAPAGDASSFAYVDYLRGKVADTTAGVNTFWNFASSKQESSNPCLADTSRVLGIVTTNAMVYDGGIPKFSRGFLDYQVAGMHYQPDGITKVEGSYDLVMRSEVARCLYGFANAPLSATISVVGGGDKTIATTIVNEKNGWLKLAAYGFTFSKKTIRAKITKAKPTRIVCVSVADESKVRNIRAINPKCPKGFARKVG
jgi:hypothetical protein